MANRHKNKGDNYERELARYLNDNTCLADVARAPLSGGGYIHHDIGGADLINTPGIFIEAKRMERPNLLGAYRQAEVNRAKTGSHDRIVVMTRASRVKTGESYCLLKLDEFLEMYNAWLEKNGYSARNPPAGVAAVIKDERQIDLEDELNSISSCFHTDSLV